MTVASVVVVKVSLVNGDDVVVMGSVVVFIGSVGADSAMVLVVKSPVGVAGCSIVDVSMVSTVLADGVVIISGVVDVLDDPVVEGLIIVTLEHN